MKLFDRTGPIKWILVLLLVFLGVGSMVYNQYLINRILEQEKASVQLWAKALEFNALPIHQESSRLLLSVIGELESRGDIPDSLIQKLVEVEGMRSMQNFVTDELILDNRGNFKLPAVLVDDNDRPLEYILIDDQGDLMVEYSFRNVRNSQIETEEKRLAYVQKLKNMNPPIPIIVGEGEGALRQFIYYGESTVGTNLTICSCHSNCCDSVTFLHRIYKFSQYYPNGTVQFMGRNGKGSRPSIRDSYIKSTGLDSLISGRFIRSTRTTHPFK